MATDFAQFPWSGKNNFFTRCAKNTLVFGSSEGDYAIWIPDNLLRGTSKPCETYMNPTLTREKDFEVKFSPGLGDMSTKNRAIDRV